MPMLRTLKERRDSLILAAGLLASLILCFGPLENPDLPWHLAAGKQIAATRSVPREDFLSWTKAGQPWIDFEWGTQVIYNGLYAAGGMKALWLFKSASCFAVALLLVALLRLWKFPDSWTGLAAAPFMLALFPSTDIRPEIFSMFFFMAQLYALEKRRLGLLRLGEASLLAAHAAFYALWANLHPAFAAGLALCAIYGLAELARTRQKIGRTAALKWAAAGLAGTCVNPYGIGLYAIFWEHWKQLGTLHQLITEWNLPRIANLLQGGYWLLLLFSYAGFLLAVYQGIALPAEHLAAIVVFSLLASRSYRTTVYIPLLVFPLGLAAWRRLSPPPWWPKAKLWALAAVLIVTASMAVHLVRSMGLLRRVGRLSDLGPPRACAFLAREKATLSGLHLYNPYDWGGYIDYTLYPDYKIFMDGRYLFPDLLAQVAKAEGNPMRWKRLMDDQGIELALLPNNGHEIRYSTLIDWRAFEAYAMPRTDWALVYWDSQAMILVRRSKVPQEWLKPREYRLLRPHDLRHLGLQVLSGVVPISAVSDEIDRYQREIGDPFQDLVLTHWFAEFKKGLEPAHAPGRL